WLRAGGPAAAGAQTVLRPVTPPGVRLPQNGLRGPGAGRTAAADTGAAPGDPPCWDLSPWSAPSRLQPGAGRAARCPPRRWGRCRCSGLGDATTPLTLRRSPCALIRHGSGVRASELVSSATHPSLAARAAVLVGSHQDITEGSFSLFWMLEPRIEIVVVGTGDRTERLQPQVLRAMRQRGIAVEVQDTPNACATFNFLCHEGRVTGAALIPPPGGAALTSLAQVSKK
uniref:NADH dehydrogenase [ubiquinone] 1 alpha subcomplex assembly factor 3 n=1 Tax=Sus scrofa TaxID=9823 RepID=A0A4X1SXX8_PIG